MHVSKKIFFFTFSQLKYVVFSGILAMEVDVKKISCVHTSYCSIKKNIKTHRLTGIFIWAKSEVIHMVLI